METAIDIQAESFVRELAAAIIAPRGGECLACYLDRVLRDAPCDGSLRLARTYRDALAPRAVALEGRLESGGGFCDCEVLMNVYWSKTDEVRPCRGARRGSTKPCDLWLRRRRGDRW